MSGSEDDCVIECLDEDVEIVQHYVQKVDDVKHIIIKTEPEDDELLQERPEKRKKVKREEEDSDYDPAEEYRQRFKKKMRPSRPIFKRESVPDNTSKGDFRRRRLLDIRIPDYEDPLCLPVRSYSTDEYSAKRLRNWNNLCLKYMKMYETPLRPDVQETFSSSRCVVLRNAYSKDSGKVDTTVWSKLTVENKQGMQKSEIFQAVLPRYKEKKALNTIILRPKLLKSVQYKEEVILTKEFNKNEDMLIVYKPKQALSCTYKMIEEKVEGSDEEPKRYLKEVVACKMCAPCYQMSWRGVLKSNSNSMKCCVCNITCSSAFNLLSHLRGHSQAEVRANKMLISKTLSEVLRYHYECRICSQKCGSIKGLRSHIKAHKGKEPFLCEIGGHVAS
ncbi:unnamed protein product [Leptosia nina]|uniref:C2H2-type domain-containing protein n=1 Tax=Leptosia nina TaxID=320188 RepID=A0AAV1JFY9_9NEOP